MLKYLTWKAFKTMKLFPEGLIATGLQFFSTLSWLFLGKGPPPPFEQQVILPRDLPPETASLYLPTFVLFFFFFFFLFLDWGELVGRKFGYTYSE